MKLAVRTLSFSLLATVCANTFAADAPVAGTPVAGTPVAAADKPAAAPGPNQAKQAIAVRNSAYTLIKASFSPIGDVLQGKAEYNQADIEKRVKRIVVLNEFLDGAFPEVSNLGEPDTKAKAEIWTQRADFDKRLKDFKDHTATLAEVVAKEKTASDAFKEAAGAVAKDCKGCHDKYKAK